MKTKFSPVVFALSIGTAAMAATADDVTELDTVEVNAKKPQPQSKFSPASDIVEGDKLRGKVGQTIGETLKDQLGVASQSFGAGVGTPVIRGLSGPRVRVLQNSIGNNDVSQISPDHANSVEPLLAERVEVLRGPSTLVYGSGLTGGVVNVIDNRIPENRFDKLFNLQAEQRYESVSNGIASTGKIEGGQDNLAYHFDGFYRGQDNVHIGGNAINEADARATDSGLVNVPELVNPPGVLPNSSGRSFGGSAGFSWLGDNAQAGSAINYLANNYGVPPDGSGGTPVRINLRQSKYDFKGRLDNPLPFAQTLRYKVGYTDYRHDEIDGGVVGTTFLNKTIENRVELEHKPVGNITGLIGFQSLNSEFSALGEEAFVPESDINGYSIFAVESIKSGPLNYQLGLRTEWQSVDAATQQSFSYTPISGSAAVEWPVDDKHRFNLAFTHSERAPQVQELLSFGVHDATRSFEIGNDGLDIEASNNLDLGYRYQYNGWQAEINLFHNWVDGFISQNRNGQVFNENIEAFETVCSAETCVPVQVTGQNDAIFKGFEAQFTAPLMENKAGVADVTVFSDYTRAEFVNGGDVARIPPLRYGIQLNYGYNAFTSSLRLTRAEAQTKAGANETATRGYVRLDLNGQYRLAGFKGTEVTLFVNGKNLLNENIRNSTSFLRSFAPESGRSAEIGVRVSY
ncbi:MAG: TonB-dependent receptor [Methylobacter sp.]|nr:MAG: TonB-dependent receptor [Methylobacter sp.]